MIQIKVNSMNSSATANSSPMLSRRMNNRVTDSSHRPTANPPVMGSNRDMPNNLRRMNNQGMPNNLPPMANPLAMRSNHMGNNKGMAKHTDKRSNSMPESECAFWPFSLMASSSGLSEV